VYAWSDYNQKLAAYNSWTNQRDRYNLYLQKQTEWEQIVAKYDQDYKSWNSAIHPLLKDDTELKYYDYFNQHYLTTDGFLIVLYLDENATP